MTILKLYGTPHGASPLRIATVLHELHIPFEFIEVDLKAGEQHTPAFLARQPFGQVPFIDDGGFILYESRAICRYLAAKHPASGLIPREPTANALFEQAASVEVANFDPSASGLVLQTVVKPAFYGTQPDPAAVQAHLAVLEKKLEGYEAILGTQRYLAGDTLTLADLFHLPCARLLAVGGIDIMMQKPNVARWYNELIARPSSVAYEGGVKTTTTSNITKDKGHVRPPPANQVIRWL
ncbi:glutathione S-transferase [Mycena rosella]|uniref:glutathione transferase n=1 Tax=Mycena rosella TaxID=1033263 RepID=A0AAD7G4Z9_MYCRO|nr:glutathione S-transferase [Mycena rosella]